MYKMTTYLERKLCIVITLKWNHIKHPVELSMTGYVEVVLQEFQHLKPSWPQESPYLWTSPTYGANSQLTPPPDTTPILLPGKRTRLKIVIGKFLYYCWDIGTTMAVYLNKLSAHQTKGTKSPTKTITNFLNYCATHTKSTLEYKASDIILYTHSDASYLGVPEGQICTRGFLLLVNQPQDPTKLTTVISEPNGPLYLELSIVRSVMVSSIEAKLGALFTNGQRAAPIRTTLIEKYHPHRPPPLYPTIHQQ